MGEPDCPGCRELQRRVTELETLVRELQARLGQNATNSSVPPSANPVEAPKPVAKTPTGKKPGGQPGHAPCVRVRLPPEQVHEVIHHRPLVCCRCHVALPEAPGADDPEPTWHQVAELPPIATRITEHQGHTRTCPHCGTHNHAPIPPDVRAHALGPRLTAVMAYLSGARHDSKRGVEEVVETVFGVPVALGTVTACEQEASQALALAHAEVAQAVQQAPVKHADETGWKQAGRLCWLWAAVTPTLAFFRVQAGRGVAGMKTLLGEVVVGIVLSDRWHVYNRLDVYRRQLCWPTSSVTSKGWWTGAGAGKELGEQLLALTQDVFHWWYRVRDGTLTRSTLRKYADSQRPWLRDRLQDGAGCGCAKAEALCQSLLALEPALWTFTRVAGVEPTNNAAERALRPAVLWRRRSFGCHSAAGCRFVERMLTVVQTLRLQRRGVLDYLVDAIQAHRQGLPQPKLLPGG